MDGTEHAGVWEVATRLVMGWISLSHWPSPKSGWCSERHF